MAPHQRTFQLNIVLILFLSFLSCTKDSDVLFETVQDLQEEKDIRDGVDGEISDESPNAEFEANNDSYNIVGNQENVILNVIENDNIPVGQIQNITITATSNPESGSLSLNDDNSFSYSPFENFENRAQTVNDLFTYTLELTVNGVTSRTEASVAISTQYMGELKAFPGAEGFGRYTTGGRGGNVYHVTNLNDNGFGSFRDAVERDNRIIVFDVSGTIELQTDLYISGSNLTIAGETAPGDGIAIFGDETILTGQNIIIRHLHFRNGDSQSDEDTFRILSAYNKGRYSNYMIDHCSFSWGDDETVAVETGDNGDVFVDNITFQNCIISESFNNKNFILYGGNQTGISIIKNLFANTSSRSIRSNQGSNGFGGNFPKEFELIDNLIYHYDAAVRPEDGAIFDVIGNVFLDGPNTQKYETIRLEGPEQCNSCDINGTSAFIEDNLWNGGNATISSNLSQYMKSSRVSSSGYNSIGSNNVQSYVLNNAGARNGVSGLDDLDDEMVNDVINGTGSFVTNMSQTSGLPYISNEVRPNNYDTDNDGMADTWEIQNFGNLSKTASGDENSDGYTNIEEFLHFLITSN